MSAPNSSLLNPKSSWRRACNAAAVVFGGIAALVIIWLFSGRGNMPPSAGLRLPTIAGSATPAESLSTVRQVIISGGEPLAREAAIAWLDRQARERLVLDTEAQTLLLDTLRRGGNPAWSSGYRQHLFNSACNALRVAPADGGDGLARILQSHALSHPDRVLRLYSLQHIDSMRNAGQLSAALAAEARIVLQSLAMAPDSDVAGAALKVLGGWSGASPATPPAMIELAARIAADRSRSVDVRVCALHSAGSSSLEPSRVIAADPTEPVLLRKAAIARIGRHGDEADLPRLHSLRVESARLGQAADPALQAITRRTDSPGNSTPVPYPSPPSSTTP